VDATLPKDELQPRTEAEEVRLRDAGFRWGEKGTHTSRTIMLKELRAVLANCRPDAMRDDYLAAIHEDNCLGKRTAATRKLSSQRLSELYALDPKVPLFRIMRRCWYATAGGLKRYAQVSTIPERIFKFIVHLAERKLSAEDWRSARLGSRVVLRASRMYS
jgi:hypothetical protein